MHRSISTTPPVTVHELGAGLRGKQAGSEPT
jgi:hypothetical protein